MQRITRFIGRVLSFILLGLRPLLGPATCKHPVSCTAFAVEQLRRKALHKALYTILVRVASCISYRK